MPHEIVMPALGMAQDTGLIVSWLKSSGDAVTAGDALMEIETDKAIMEVEAQVDGFLTKISAAAGEHVPVGQVVGVISESLESMDSDDSSAGEPSAATENVTAIPEGHEFILPALGMAQENGLIIAWRKSLGDQIVADDILLEVETDKSIMDVEAGRKGYLAAILAHEQDQVPVGSVIAIISDKKPENPVSRGYFSASGPAASPVSAKSSLADKASSPQSTATETQATAKAGSTQNAANKTKAAAHVSVVPKGRAMGERILASPKARRLALEQGLRLERLVELGVEQPYHIADLEALRHDSANAGHVASQTGLSETTGLRISATVSSSGSDALIDWLAHGENVHTTHTDLFLRFTTAAFRQAFELTDHNLCVAVQSVSGQDACYNNADRYRFSQSIPGEKELPPRFRLRDLTDSPITSIDTGAGEHKKNITICRKDDQFEIMFDYQADSHEERSAIQFVADLAERLDDPILNLF